MSKKIYIITGHSNQGKTSWIAGAIEFLSANQKNFSGVYCPSVLKHGQKSAIDCVLLPEMNKICLAKKNDHFSEGFLEKWTFDDSAIKIINKHFENIDYCSYLICDEIGPLELIKGAGFTSAIKFLQSQNFESAIVAIRPSMIAHFKKLFPASTQFIIINAYNNPDYHVLLK